MVADELLDVENGGDAKFTQYLHRKLSAILADFIVNSKVLDGSDESCFTMVPDDKLEATRCEAKLHVLTPKELEALVTKAFEAGVNVGRKAESYGPKMGDRIRIRQPWEQYERQKYEMPNYDNPWELPGELPQPTSEQIEKAIAKLAGKKKP